MIKIRIVINEIKSRSNKVFIDTKGWFFDKNKIPMKSINSSKTEEDKKRKGTNCQNQQ